MELALEPWARELLRCPVCHGKLEDREVAPAGLECALCAVSYPVENGIPVLLEDDARKI